MGSIRLAGNASGSADGLDACSGVSGSCLTTTTATGFGFVDEDAAGPGPVSALPSGAGAAGAGAAAAAAALASRFLRCRGRATRSVMSMITEPCTGPEHRSPSRRHCWHSSGVSSHCAQQPPWSVERARRGREGGYGSYNTLTRRSRHCWQARERCALGICVPGCLPMPVSVPC